MGSLTSLSVVGLQAPVGALTVVDAFHVAGVFVEPGMQHDVIHPIGLQRLYVLKRTHGLFNTTEKRIYTGNSKKVFILLFFYKPFKSIRLWVFRCW